MQESLMGAARLMAEVEAMAGLVAHRPAHTGLGRILTGYELYVYGFRGSADAPIRVPVGKWLVARTLTLPAAVMTLTAADGGHDHGGGGHSQFEGSGDHSHGGGPHGHAVATPRALARLRVGDVVSVVWIGGAIPYVEDVVVSSRAFLLPGEVLPAGYTGAPGTAQQGGDAGAGAGTGMVPPETGNRYYTRPGDTWASAAAATGRSEAELRAYNNDEVYAFPQPFAPGTPLFWG